MDENTISKTLKDIKKDRLERYEIVINSFNAILKRDKKRISKKIKEVRLQLIMAQIITNAELIRNLSSASLQYELDDIQDPRIEMMKKSLDEIFECCIDHLIEIDEFIHLQLEKDLLDINNPRGIELMNLGKKNYEEHSSHLE